MDSARQWTGASVVEASVIFGQKLLIAGGILSALASLLHIGVIIGGPEWYRFFGAGEDMAQMAEKGSLYPVFITLGITLVLAIWAYYAFAGAGLFWRPPLLQAGLILIAAIYLLRGLILFPLLVFVPENVNSFGVWSSLIILVYGLFYAVGTWKVWSNLSLKSLA